MCEFLYERAWKEWFRIKITNHVSFFSPQVFPVNDPPQVRDLPIAPPSSPSVDPADPPVPITLVPYDWDSDNEGFSVRDLVGEWIYPCLVWKDGFQSMPLFLLVCPIEPSTYVHNRTHTYLCRIP